MKYLVYALSPLLILLSCITLACVLGYVILLYFGDIYSLNKLISRLSQLFLVLSLFPLRRCLHLSWAELGFAPKTKFFKQLIVGFIAGFATLLPVFVVLYGLGVNVFDDTKIWTSALLLKKTGLMLVLSLLISWIEEPLFRGLLLTGLQRKLALNAAILLSAAYYGSLHFLETSREIPYSALQFDSGFQLFAEALNHWLNPTQYSAFIALVMVGIFLGVVRTHVSQSLGVCIGLHTSWVWQIKVNKALFNPNYFSEYFYLVSAYDGLVGPLVAGWLGTVLFIYFAFQRYLKKTFELSD